MSSINLLPEVRVVKIAEAKKKRVATTSAILSSLIILGIMVGLIALIGYYAGESRTRANTAKNLQADVDKYHDMELDATTIQEHMSSFTSLNGKRIAASAIFSQLVKTIPPDVSVNSFNLSQSYLATIGGTTSSYKQLGVFAQALQDYNVTFKPQPDLDRKPIFTNIVITQSSKDVSSGRVTYVMTFNVDQSVLASNKNTN